MGWRNRGAARLWGQPGKVKVTAFLENGRMGAFADAIAFIEANPDADPGASINAVRRWNLRPGGAAGDRRHRRVRASWVGRRQPRTMEFHRYRPHGAGRCFNLRQIMGQAGRYSGDCRRHQRHFQHPSGLLQRRGAWAFSSAMDNCPTPVRRKFSRLITAMR